MIKIYVLTFLLFCATGVNSQTTFLKNTLYLEAGGNGLFSSFNYERQLTKLPGFSARAGIGVYSEKGLYLTIPIGIDLLLPLKKPDSYIDAGFGATWAAKEGKLFSNDKNSEDDRYINFIPSVGYRHHTSKNIMWRVSLTPVINKYTFVPWVGVAIGKLF